LQDLGLFCDDAHTGLLVISESCQLLNDYSSAIHSPQLHPHLTTSGRLIVPHFYLLGDDTRPLPVFTVDFSSSQFVLLAWCRLISLIHYPYHKYVLFTEEKVRLGPSFA
jgi:hypothetical protein